VPLYDTAHNKTRIFHDYYRHCLHQQQTRANGKLVPGSFLLLLLRTRVWCKEPKSNTDWPPLLTKIDSTTTTTTTTATTTTTTTTTTMTTTRRRRRRRYSHSLKDSHCQLSLTHSLTHSPTHSLALSPSQLHPPAVKTIMPINIVLLVDVNALLLFVTTPCCVVVHGSLQLSIDNNDCLLAACCVFGERKYKLTN